MQLLPDPEQIAPQPLLAGLQSLFLALTLWQNCRSRDKGFASSCRASFALPSVPLCLLHHCICPACPGAIKTRSTNGSQGKGGAEAGVLAVARTMSPISPHSIACCPPCQAKSKLWKQCHESSRHRQHLRLSVRHQGGSCPSVSSLYPSGVEQHPLGQLGQWRKKVHGWSRHSQ